MQLLCSWRFRSRKVQARSDSLLRDNPPVAEALMARQPKAEMTNPDRAAALWQIP